MCALHGNGARTRVETCAVAKAIVPDRWEAGIPLISTIRERQGSDVNQS